MNHPALTLHDDTAGHRFQALDGTTPVGLCAYELSDTQIVFTHTEVLPEHEGKGVGSFLAKGVLDEARRRGLRVVPACSFIAAYIDRHTDYQDLVAAGR